MDLDERPLFCIISQSAFQFFLLYNVLPLAGEVFFPVVGHSRLLSFGTDIYFFAVKSTVYLD